MFKRILAASIIAMALLFGCTDKAGHTGGAMAADFTLQDLSGKDVKLSDMRGKVVRARVLGHLVPALPRIDPGH